jgi:Zn-dependent protease with chaperone function
MGDAAPEPSRSFWEETRRNRRKLLFLLAAYLVLALVVGRMLGWALLHVVDGVRYYEAPWDPDYASPPFHLDYVNHVTAAVLVLAWARYRSIRRRGHRMILSLVGARPLDERRFRNVAAEMAVAAGISAPRLYVAEDPSLNAFAVGSPDGDGAVIVTRGLLEHLERDELQAVVAHEVGHIRNGDARLATVLFGLSRALGVVQHLVLGPLKLIVDAARKPDSGKPFDVPKPPDFSRLKERRPWLMPLLPFCAPLLGVLVLGVSLAVSLLITAAFVLVVHALPWLVLAYAGWELWKLRREARPPAGRPKRFNPRKPRSAWSLLYLAPAGLVVGPAILILGVVAPLVALLLRLAVSRNREFQADVAAVEFTRDPAALQSALEKLRAQRAPAEELPGSLTPLTVVPVRRRGITSPAADEALRSLLAELREKVPGARAVAWVLSLFRTHPPLEDRIERVEDMVPRARRPRRPAPVLDEVAYTVT